MGDIFERLFEENVKKIPDDLTKLGIIGKQSTQFKVEENTEIDQRFLVNKSV